MSAPSQETAAEKLATLFNQAGVLFASAAATRLLAWMRTGEEDEMLAEEIRPCYAIFSTQAKENGYPYGEQIGSRTVALRVRDQIVQVHLTLASGEVLISP